MFKMAAQSRLPPEIRKKIFGDNYIDEDHVRTVIDRLMNPLNQAPDEGGGTSNKFLLHLEKVPCKKWPKPRQHQRKTLSYKERRILGLYSISKSSLKYVDMIPLNYLWQDYMKKYIDLQELSDKESDDFDEPLEQTGIKLFRADYHGAELVVSRSKCPGYVGKGGIVAMETKNCFAVVGKDNITRKIPKSQCEFTFKIGDRSFSFFGKNFISRPADRSSKKIKTIHTPGM